MSAKDYKPDCGYAWMVVLGCFTINFIMAGLARAAGVLYTSLIDTYGVSREVATTPFSLRFCMRNMSGPVVGALGQRFGIRPVVLLGGLICGLGGVLSSLAPNVTWITVAWGGIHGLGYGMCNLIHLIVINRYFDKYKGLAIGISLTGDCFGTFVLPVILELLLSVYDLRGTFLILAGISLNVVPAAMLLRSPSWEKKSPINVPPQQKSAAKLNNINEKQIVTNVEFNSIPGHCENNAQLNTMQISLPTIIDNASSKSERDFTGQEVDVKFQKDDGNIKIGAEEIGKRNQMEYTDLCANDKRRDHTPCDTLIIDICSIKESESVKIINKNQKKLFACNFKAFDMKNRRSSMLSVLSCPSHMGKCTSDFKHGPCPQSQTLYACNACSTLHKGTRNHMHGEQIVCIHQDSVMGAGNECNSVRNVYSNQHPPMYGVPLHDEKHLVQSTPHENFHYPENHASNASALIRFLKTNTKPILLVMSATLALYVFLFISVFTIINDYVSDNNIPGEYGKYLIIAFSVTDVFGRIGLGIVLDKNWIAPRHFAGLTTGLMGFFIIIIPLYKCFTFWMISFSLCGFVQGGSAMMYPILVDYYMDKGEETVALGSLNFYGGVLMLPIPSMIGYFRDNIGSYDGVFWTVGALCMLAAALWIFEPCIVTKQKTNMLPVACTGDDKTTKEGAKY